MYVLSSVMSSSLFFVETTTRVQGINQKPLIEIANTSISIGPGQQSMGIISQTLIDLIFISYYVVLQIL
jgi:hypothetical protein